MLPSKSYVGLTATFMALVSTPVIEGQKIYWTDESYDRIRRSNLDGSNVEDVLVSVGLRVPDAIVLDDTTGKMCWVHNKDSTPREAKVYCANRDGSAVEELVTVVADNVHGLAIDPVERKLYWSETFNDRIQRASLDGTEVEEVMASDIDWPSAVAIDYEARKIYWTDRASGSYSRMRRANLDGANIEQVAVSGSISSIALDLFAGKVYWTADRFIKRADLNGANSETFVDRAGYPDPRSVAIDDWSGRVYWLEGGSLRRADPDGSNIQTVGPTVLSWRTSLAVDGLAQRLFWTYQDDNKIQGASIDGSNIEDLVRLPAFHAPRDVALDLTAGKIYWADDNYDGMNRIRRADLDGSNLEDIVTPAPLRGPGAIALDAGQGRIYISDQSYIMRSSLVHSSVESLIGMRGSGPQGVERSIAIDSTAQKLYWVDHRVGLDGVFSRADLNGANIENLATGQSAEAGIWSARGFALYLPTGDVYWTSGASIGRCDLDGSNSETLVSTGLTKPQSIAIDAIEGKLYWTDGGSEKIQRGNLDGSGVEDVVAAPATEGIGWLALDNENRVIYWTVGSVSYGLGKVFRADFDGSNIDLVVEGLYKPQGIIVDPVRGLLCWADEKNKEVKCANTDGSFVHYIAIEDIYSPRNISLDVAASKLYWADRSVLWRSNTDGSSIERIGLRLNDLFIDTTASTIYFLRYFNNGRAAIGRADLNGLNDEELFTIYHIDPYATDMAVDVEQVYWLTYRDVYTGECEVRTAAIDGSGLTELFSYNYARLTSLALDVEDQTLYWGQRRLSGGGWSGIRRGGFDGTGLETLYSAGGAPSGIALDLRWLGDSDLDRDIDLKDLAIFQLCFGSDAAAPISLECMRFDTIPTDQCIDMIDLAAIGHVITGP